MRHHYNRLLELSTGVQKKSNVLRNLITSLLKEKRITTTPKRAKVLKYEIEKLFAKLVRTYNRYENKEDAKREVKRILTAIVYDKATIDEIIDSKLLPYIKENRVSWFARNYKVGVRRGDAVEKVMVELV